MWKIDGENGELQHKKNFWLLSSLIAGNMQQA